ncbi:hypothetical protein FA95DRAFT_1600966 [Auriscalpium vulgare]|uniref:Uncharacterized protein n=1 Tax=Auriscalpium vulgare TaxID=40419 RepID=A0ACB8SBM0_9AGAM|nr:hypothetical protein FA95DRAFT_1600966 [Auriscalpium vulgare]
MHAEQVARGHKAAINNPNVSEEAKDRSRQALEDLEGKTDSAQSKQAFSAQGHKAALNNPNVSEEAKQNSQKALDDLSG